MPHFCKSIPICIMFKTVAKSKREKVLEIEELAKKGGGESYIDTSRGIAVGMGKRSF